jgi:multimeric flavodoxin WrbA
MKIIGINGSPRKKASITLKLILAELIGAKTEDIDLCKLDINFCTGCLSCFATGDCVYDDDVSSLLEKMKKADGIVPGSPVYIDSVTAQLKRWIDRSANTMHCMMLLGKYGCAVSISGGFKE